MTKRFTNKQKIFISEYLVDLNATRAAIKAGYSAKTATQIGSKLLTNVDIKAEIDQQIAEHLEKTGITTDYVLTSIKEVVERCMQRKPVMVRQGKEYVQATEYVEQPDGSRKEEGVWAFDASGANFALKMLGLHLKLFTEKVEASGKDGGPIKTEGDTDAKIKLISAINRLTARIGAPKGTAKPDGQGSAANPL